MTVLNVEIIGVIGFGLLAAYGFESIVRELRLGRERLEQLNEHADKVSKELQTANYCLGMMLKQLKKSPND
jgi:hypothetical protein